MSVLNGCEKDIDPIADEPAVIAVINSEDGTANATIVAGCFEFEKKDTFSIILDKYPEGVTAIYTATPIPDTLRIDGLRIVISGTVFDTTTINRCETATDVNLAANKFEITEIKKLENTVKTPPKLQGTKWKLEGIVNEQTGERRALEPIDCEQCYTLKFDTDTTATGKSTTNEQKFNFARTPIFLATTEICEINEDGDLYSDLLFDIKAYKFEDDALYFYCAFEGTNYILKFKKLENITEMPPKLKGTKWKLEGIVNEQTDEMQILEPTDCEQCYTLEFETDTTGTGYTTTNIMFINLKQSPYLWTGTEVGEMGDGSLFSDALMLTTHYEYDNESIKLKFFYKQEEKSYYLLFKKLPDAVDDPRIVPILVGEGSLYSSGREGFSKEFSVIKTEQEWETLKTKLNSVNRVTDNFTETDIDFSLYQVLFVIDEVKGNGGWSIDITEIENQANQIVVTVTNLNKGNASSVITQPYQIVKIPVSDKEVQFVWKNNYPIGVYITDFSLPAECDWNTDIITYNNLYVIRSTEELSSLTTCSADSYSIDFEQYSLLYVEGVTASGIQYMGRNLMQLSDNEYSMTVSIKLNDATVVQRWNVFLKILKIDTNKKIMLNINYL
jgi:hypothetical protein